MPLDPVSDGEEATTDENRNSMKTKKGLTRYYITVEPIKFVLGFTAAFTNGVMIDLIQRNVCHVNYNLTSEQCWSRNITSQMKSDIESKTAEVNMLNQVAQGFFPLFLVLFIGPWSDTNGRKPFILFPIAGYLLYYASWAMFSFFPDIPVFYLFLPSIPLGLTGSEMALLVCSWSYSCDNFDADERPMRFSISMCTRVIGGLVGNALSGQVVHLGGDYGYQIVFITSFTLTLFSFVYTAFFLEETIVRLQGTPRTRLFDFENIKSVVTVLFIKPEKGVLLSVLIFAILLCEIPLSAGDDAMIYLIGKTQYNWNLNKYNLIAAISSIISAISPVFLVWLLTKVMNVNNITVLVISSMLLVFTEILKALSVNEIMFWFSTFGAKLSAFMGPNIDAELSYIVSDNDMGKAFTMISICDSLSPLMSIPFYTLVYKLFLPNHTLYLFFISASLATLALIASVGLFFKKATLAYTRQYNTQDDYSD